MSSPLRFKHRAGQGPFARKPVSPARSRENRIDWRHFTLHCRESFVKTLARGVGPVWRAEAGLFSRATKGVIRAALFASTPVNMPIRWHDLRATCGTWLAVAGRSSTDIRDVLGHTQVSMTDRYMRNASAVRGGQFGEPFPALPLIRHRSVIDDSALTIEPKTSTFSGADGSITVAPSACAGTSRR